jgi:hypothetical protein
MHCLNMGFTKESPIDLKAERPAEGAFSPLVSNWLAPSA